MKLTIKLSTIVVVVSIILGNITTVRANVIINSQGNPSPCIIEQNTKWYIISAEKDALYRQIFSLSKSIVSANKNRLKQDVVCGVIFDIDETLLNNAQYQYENNLQCKSFNQQSWNIFINRQESISLAGAVDITNYIHKIGCKVNLVSGRDIGTQAATESNLRKEGIYFDQVLLSNKMDGSNKNPRFMAIINGVAPSKVKTKQTIIAYYGDNIATDFPNSTQEQYLNEDENGAVYNQFGVRYFVLPNPTYGSWEHNKLH